MDKGYADRIYTFAMITVYRIGIPYFLRNNIFRLKNTQNTTNIMKKK